MLDLYITLFDRLNNEIPYVVWKACHEIQMFLDGEGDIDLLVDAEFQKQFAEILGALGFIQAHFNALTFPYIEHYYGCDAATGAICHLHVYFRIVTGGSHLKSYYIPIEKEIIRNRFLNKHHVYEASYQDQALIYTMRHYMKRASWISLLFWVYEKKDYHAEYDYIAGGLALTKGSSTESSCENLRTEFNFQQICLPFTLSEYLRARTKISKISSFRRFNAFEAFWRNFYNLGIRLFYKVMRVRKRFEDGLVLAVSGVDGSGKSSMVKELQVWLGRQFDVEVLHLGKPSPAPITLPLRISLFLYRLLSGKSNRAIEDSSEYGDSGVLKKRNGFIWAVRYVALAYERYRLACMAHHLKAKGKIIICDRYPTNSPGKMDSPRIAPGGSKLVEQIRQYELGLYDRVPRADYLFFLDVSREEAINRNRGRIKKDKETDGEISFRHSNNQGLDYRANQIFFVNANRDYQDVLKDLKSISWKGILSVNRQ